MSSIILYGPPGTGKTTLASTMCNLGYRTHFIDVDRKLRTMKNLEPLVKAEKVTFHELNAKLVDSTLAERIKKGPKQAPLTQPKGFMEVVNYIDDLERNPPEWGKGSVLVLDSLTRLVRHMVRYLQFLQKRAVFQYEDWGFLKINLEELFTCFFGLQPDVFQHCIIICHAMDEKDEVIQTIETRPAIEGSMRNEAGGYVEEMYYTKVDAPKQGPAKFTVQTKPSGRIQQARSSRDVPTFCESDFGVIFKGEGPIAENHPLFKKKEAN